MVWQLKSTVLAGLVGLALQAGGAAAQTVTYSTDGGKFLDAQRTTLIPAAEKASGAKISVEANGDRYPIVKASVGMNNPQWDIVDIGAGYCIRGVED